MFISTVAFRVVTFVLMATATGWVAFRCTPELDGVENKWIYRVSYWSILARGVTFMLFNMLRLFPLE